jgi:translation initiation factor IF-1
MSKEDLIELTGKVEELLPNNMFKVCVAESNMTLICYTNGRLRKHKIRIVAGDTVKLEVSVYDLTKGRITFRL